MSKQPVRPLQFKNRVRVVSGERIVSHVHRELAVRMVESGQARPMKSSGKVYQIEIVRRPSSSSRLSSPRELTAQSYAPQRTIIKEIVRVEDHSDPLVQSHPFRKRIVFAAKPVKADDRWAYNMGLTECLVELVDCTSQETPNPR